MNTQIPHAQGVNRDYLLNDDRNFLIMVEGPSDRAMIGEMLRSLGLDLPAYQIMSYGGKDNFRHVWKNITNQPNFSNVSSIAVFRDADSNPQGAFESVQYHFRDSQKIPDDAVPSTVAKVAIGADLKSGVFVFPDGASDGALEELLLSSLGSDLLSHISEYVAGAENHLSRSAQAIFKNSSI